MWVKGFLLPKEELRSDKWGNFLTGRAEKQRTVLRDIGGVLLCSEWEGWVSNCCWIRGSYRHSDSLPTQTLRSTPCNGAKKTGEGGNPWLLWRYVGMKIGWKFPWLRPFLLMKEHRDPENPQLWAPFTLFSFDIRMSCLLLWPKIIWKIACISQERAVSNKKSQWSHTIKYISHCHHSSISWWKKKAWKRPCSMQSFQDPVPAVL